MPALVISIDGPDFSGKTTIANLTIELLREVNKNKNLSFRRTNLPSSLTTGTFTSILRNSSDKFSPEVFTLVYAADHVHHFNTQIKPLKESGQKFVVIQERSLLTTFLYQSILGDIKLDWVREVNKFDKNIPNITLILKLDIDELVRRKKLENRQSDEFETAEHLEKQVKNYYNLPKELIEEFNVEYIDANNSPLIVAGKCARRIQKELETVFG